MQHTSILVYVQNLICGISIKFYRSLAFITKHCVIGFGLIWFGRVWDYIHLHRRGGYKLPLMPIKDFIQTQEGDMQIVILAGIATYLGSGHFTLADWECTLCAQTEMKIYSWMLFRTCSTHVDIITNMFSTYCEISVRFYCCLAVTIKHYVIGFGLVWDYIHLRRQGGYTSPINVH